MYLVQFKIIKKSHNYSKSTKTYPVVGTTMASALSNIFLWICIWRFLQILKQIEIGLGMSQKPSNWTNEYDMFIDEDAYTDYGLWINKMCKCEWILQVNPNVAAC